MNKDRSDDLRKCSVLAVDRNSSTGVATAHTSNLSTSTVALGSLREELSQGPHEVRFGPGPLGLHVIRRADWLGPVAAGAVSESAVVERLSGAAAESGKIQAGDILLSVNDCDTSQLHFTEAFQALKSASRPLRVTLMPVLAATRRLHAAESNNTVQASNLSVSAVKHATL